MLETFPLPRVGEWHVSRLKTYFRPISARTLILLLFSIVYPIRGPSNSSSLLARSKQKFYKGSLFSSANNFSPSLFFFVLSSFRLFVKKIARYWGAPVGWELYKRKLCVNSTELLIETNERGDLERRSSWVINRIVSKQWDLVFFSP